MPCDIFPFLIRRRAGFRELHQVKKLHLPRAEANLSLSEKPLGSSQGA